MSSVRRFIVVLAVVVVVLILVFAMASVSNGSDSSVLVTATLPSAFRVTGPYAKLLYSALGVPYGSLINVGMLSKPSIRLTWHIDYLTYIMPNGSRIVIEAKAQVIQVKVDGSWITIQPIFIKPKYFKDYGINEKYKTYGIIRKIVSEDLKKQFLKLLMEDEEFRYAVMGLLGISDLRGAVGELVNAVKALTNEVKALREGQNALRSDVNSLRVDVDKLWVENNKMWEAIKTLQEQVKALQEGQNKLWEAVRALQDQVKALQEGQNRLWEEVKALREGQNRLWEEVRALREEQGRLVRRIDALGARWGLIAEDAFREGMRGIVEEVLGVASVGKWTYNDAKGVVYGHPAVIDVDLVIKDNIHILVEVKASASRGDVAEFWRIGKLYEEVNGVKPRLIIITPYIDEKAKELAKELGIDIYNAP